MNVFYYTVSTQSSQIDHSYGESSFESASSLQSSKGDQCADESLQQSDVIAGIKYSEGMHLNISHYSLNETQRKTLSHSFSSNSTIGSFNAGDEEIIAENWTDNSGRRDKGKEGSVLLDNQVHSGEVLQKDEHDSENDVHSELHYSSSGYYESPQDDAHYKTKFRRFRSEEERNRRKASMKLELDSELSKSNISSNVLIKNKKDILMCSPDIRKESPLFIISSPLNMKRHRSKIRRQLRRPFKNEPLTAKFQCATLSLIHI